MASLATEERIYNELIASLRNDSRQRTEAYTAPIPEKLLGYKGGGGGGGGNGQSSEGPANTLGTDSERLNMAMASHTRLRSAHVIQNQRHKGSNHYPISSRANIRMTMRRDLLEVEEQDEECGGVGGVMTSVSKLTLRTANSDGVASMGNMDCAANMPPRTMAARDGLDIRLRGRKDVRSREGAPLMRKQKLRTVAHTATGNELFQKSEKRIANKKFGTGQTEDDVLAQQVREDDTIEQGANPFVRSGMCVEDLGALSEERNSHQIQKVSQRNPEPEQLNREGGPKTNAYQQAIRRSSLTISMGAGRAMKTKISGYNFLGFDLDAEKKGGERDDKVAALWQ